VAEVGDTAAPGHPASAVPRLEPFRAYTGRDLAPEAWAVLSVTDGVRTTGQVAAACGLTVPEAIDVVTALVEEGLLRTLAEAAALPVVLPAPRLALPAVPILAPIDDLQVIRTPDGTDTAAFLRELSGLTGPVTVAPATVAPVTAPPVPEEPKRRRLFGR
jgi:hypothetical protein